MPVLHVQAVPDLLWRAQVQHCVRRLTEAQVPDVQRRWEDRCQAGPGAGSCRDTRCPQDITAVAAQAACVVEAELGAGVVGTAAGGVQRETETAVRQACLHGLDEAGAPVGHRRDRALVEPSQHRSGGDLRKGTLQSKTRDRGRDHPACVVRVGGRQEHWQGTKQCKGDATEYKIVPGPSCTW